MTVHYVVPVGSYAIGTHMDSDSDLDILCAGVIRWNHFVQILSEYNSSDIPSNANIRLLRVLDAARVPIIELMVDGVEVDLHYAWIPDLTSIYLDFQNQNKSFHPTLPEVAEYAWRDYVDLLLITFYRGFVNGESITDTELLKQSEKFITSLPAPSFIPLANRLDILILLDLFPSSPIDNRVSIHSFQLARKILRYWGMRRGVFGQRFGFIGGYTLSVLCAKVCKVLEVKLKISGEKKKITAVDIVFGFFELYSNWNWSEKSVEIFSKQSEDRKLTLPMTVFQMSPLNPLQPHVRGNAARTATAVAVAVWVDELKRSCQICAGSSLPTSKEFWNELWDPYPFIERHPFFIRIDISSSTQSTYRSIYSSLESRFLIAMLLLISQKLPGTTARLWPHRLSSNEKSDNFEGFYIIGLGKGESVQAENQKQWETVIVQICETFRYQIQSTIGDQNGAVILYLTNRQSLSIEFPNISNLQSLHDLIELDDSVDHQKFWELKKQRESHKINLGSEFGSDKGGKEVLKGKGNLRSSQDVYNRIVWDSNLDANEFLIGYEDRFTGIQEIPLKVFQQNRNIGADGNNDWIPFHRVWYFKQNSTLVWDRKTGVDLIFKK
ncbi:hypothetical protein HK096_008604 [Nowakowskiella sp. JEL0078]|nr:hypothetical protein HK096_008604 [Nowakowskiella sp. JEL0078]